MRVSKPSTTGDLRDVLAKRISQWMTEGVNGIISQNDLAAKSGVGQTTVSRILNRHVSPTLEVIESIARAFNRDVTELLKRNTTETIDYDKAAYRRLPDYEKVRVEGFIKHVIQQYSSTSTSASAN